MKKLSLVMLWFYRRVLSPVLLQVSGPACRFEPSCSAYAEEAVHVHGAARGLALAAWRLLRCQPFARGGLDPVPPLAERSANEAPREAAGTISQAGVI